MALIPFQAFQVAVGTSSTLLLEISLAGLQSQISLQVSNAESSAAATTDFQIFRKLHDAGDWLAYLGGSDFEVATTTSNASTPGPQGLPPGASAWLDVDCGAAVAVQLWATASSGGATLSIVGGARTAR